VINFLLIYHVKTFLHLSNETFSVAVWPTYTTHCWQELPILLMSLMTWHRDSVDNKVIIVDGWFSGCQLNLLINLVPLVFRWLFKIPLGLIVVHKNSAHQVLVT